MFNDGLYEVTNFTDDVLAEDHNSVVHAIRRSNSSFGGVFNYGDGRDGHLKLGVISALTDTAPTVSPAGSGNITGSAYYKISAYNLSGETAASPASTVANPVAQNVRLDIPALSSNANVTGFYIYRSTNNIDFYRIGQLPVNDAELTTNFFIDDLPNIVLSPYIEPEISNTTSNDILDLESNTSYNTLKRVFFAETLTLNSNNIEILDSDITFICRDKIIINDSEIRSRYRYDVLVKRNEYQNEANFLLNAPTSSTTLSPIGCNGIRTTDSFVDGVLGGRSAYNLIHMTSSSNLVNIDKILNNLSKQGYGGSLSNTGDGGDIGGTVFLAAKNGIEINDSSLIDCSSETLFGNVGGHAGGNIVLISDKYILIKDSTLDVHGANGGDSSVLNMIGGGGGGGGLIAIISPNISEDNEIYNVNGGSHGTNNGSGTVVGASGGGNAGRGGYNSATDFSSLGLSRDGENGIVIKANLNTQNLRF